MSFLTKVLRKITAPKDQPVAEASDPKSAEEPSPSRRDRGERGKQASRNQRNHRGSDPERERPRRRRRRRSKKPAASHKFTFRFAQKANTVRHFYMYCNHMDSCILYTQAKRVRICIFD